MHSTQLFSVSYYVKLRKLKFPQGWAGAGVMVFLITAAHVIVGSKRIDLSVNLCNGVWKIVTVTHTNCYNKVIAYIKAALSLKKKKNNLPIGYDR